MLAVERLGGADRPRRWLPARATSGRGRGSSRSGGRSRRWTTTLPDRRAVRHGAVGVLLQSGTTLPRRIAAVGGDEHLGLAVLDPPGERLGAEAAEDDRVRRPDPGAGEHRDRPARGPSACRSRRRRPCSTPSPLSTLANLRHLALQVLIAEHAAVAGLALPDQRGLVLVRPLAMAVDAVVRGVELAADEPLGERRLPVEHLLPGLEPVEDLAPARPRSPRGRPWPDPRAPRTPRGWRLALAANSGGGGKTRVSVKMLSIEPTSEFSTFIVACSLSRGHGVRRCAGIQGRRGPKILIR